MGNQFFFRNLPNILSVARIVSAPLLILLSLATGNSVHLVVDRSITQRYR